MDVIVDTLIGADAATGPVEIVERKGYKGFGAVNASIRLAAQSRETGRSAA